MSRYEEQIAGLSAAARQVVALETLLAGDFVPAGQNPLPEIESTGPAPPDLTAAGAGPELSAAEKQAAFAAMHRDEVAGCTRCPLGQSRTQAVFGEGDVSADLVFVGEGPGADEDASGRPFVGRAGKLLTKMVHAMGLGREQVYICNLVKCRPPGNRTPEPAEIEACWDYLRRQLEIIRPKVIVSLGSPATRNLLHTREGIMRLRGRWQQLPPEAGPLAGTPVMPTFHPSYVLRRYTPEVRRQVWSDLQQVMQSLDLEPPQAD